MDSQELTPVRAGFILLLALAVGFLAASVLASFPHGPNAAAFARLSPVAFWYETPLYQGEVTPLFRRGLMAMGLAMVLGFVAMGAIASRKAHHGTARWSGSHEMHKAGFLRGFDSVTGPIFGKMSGPRGFGRYLTNGEHPHSLVVAPTRAGKGVGVVVPTLLTFRGSVLALDVKGELFELTSRARRDQGHRIYKFAPFDPAGRSHRYNPILDVAEASPGRRFAEARRLAVNLVTAHGKGAEGFLDGARDLFVAGILTVIERGTPTIGAIYDLFSQPGEKYKLFAELAEQTNIPEARRIFDNMAANDTKIITSYTSVLGDGGLNLWADPLIRAATETSDFSIYKLRRIPCTIYLCVSPNDLHVIAPLVRLFFQQVVSILQRTMPGPKEKQEVLFLLDEFKHLGKLESIETAITTIAGYNGRFMFIIQSLSALTGAYGKEGRENFLSNTGIQVFMATADDETPDYISKAIGQYTYRAKSTSFRRGKMFDTNISISEQGTQLIRPEQIRLLNDREEIVLLKGRPPLKIPKVKYYEDRILRKIFTEQTGPLPEPEQITQD